MKFGKRLLREAALAPEEWRSSFIDYKARICVSQRPAETRPDHSLAIWGEMRLGLAAHFYILVRFPVSQALKKLITAGTTGAVSPDHFSAALKAEANKASVLYTRTWCERQPQVEHVRLCQMLWPSCPGCSRLATSMWRLVQLDGPSIYSS